MKHLSLLFFLILLSLGATAQITTFPYSEDFESNDGGWVTTGSNSSWEWGAPTGSFIPSSSACGTSAWVTNLDGNYSNNEASQIESPMFDFTGLTNDPILRFDLIYDTEGCCDEGWVEYSTDGGTNWTKLGTSTSGIANWYNDGSNDWWDGASGLAGEWTTAAHFLTGLAGEDSVMVRLNFDSDGSAVEEGFGLDNVVIFESLNDAAPLSLVSPIGVGAFTATETISFDLSNQGTDTITSVQACYVLDGGSAVCETFTVTINPAAISTLTFAQTGDLSTIGAHDIVVYSVLSGEDYTCNDTITAQVTTTPLIATFPYIEDFESGDGFWSATGISSTWEHGVPNAPFITEAGPCGLQAWVTNLTGDYNNNEESFMESPDFDFSLMSSDPVLRFDHIYETEGCCDEGWVEYSTNSGATWTKLGTASSGVANWYNDSGNDWWDGTSGLAGEWRTAAHVLTGLAGEDSVRIRFAFDSDGSAIRDGFGVDNIFVFESLLDASPVSFITPIATGAFTSAESVSVGVGNAGSTTITSIQVCYVLDGGTPVCETFSTSILGGTIDTLTFAQAADLSVVGAHDLVVYTNLSGEAYNCNDTIATQVTTTPLIATFPYIEDFESGDGFWSASGNSSTWEHGVPNAPFITGAGPCGLQAWVTNLTGDYNNNEESFMESPDFDFSLMSSDPVLRFDHIYETEGCCDEGWVEYSTNSGATWTKLGTASSGVANWYNDSGNDWWDGTSGLAGEWRTAAHVLTGLAGEDSVRIRFAFDSDGSAIRDGFGVDNIFVFESLLDASPVSLVTPGPNGAFGSSETVSVGIGNAGSTTITSIQVCYVLDGGVPVCQTFSTSISAGIIDTLTFVQAADLSAAGSHDFVIYTNLTGEAYNCNDTISASVTTIPNITSFPYFEGFEGTDGNWLSEGTSSSWEHGVPNAPYITGAGPCGLEAWVTNLDGDYTNNESSFLLSPYLDFTGMTNDPILRFDHIYETEGCCDEGWVEYSTNGGGSWTKLGTATSGIANWYNDGGNDWWDGNSGFAGDWQAAAHVLTGLAGHDSVQIRFAFDSDGSAVRDGFGVDNIAIFESLTDAAMSELIMPAGSGFFTSADTVSVSFQNFGSDTITSIEVCYVLDGGAPVCQTFSVNVFPTQMDTVTFTQLADLSAGGSHDFVIYTNATGEAYSCNDTIFESVTTIPIVTSFPYIEDFEASNGAWIAGGSSNSWQYGMPAASFISSTTRCGDNAWVTNLTGDYNNNENSFVESPVFDFTGITDTLTIRFDHIFETEGCCDEGWLEFSTDAGATYSKLGDNTSGIDNWYNDASNQWWDGNSGTANQWRTAAHALNTVVGQDSVRFRFMFSSDGSAVRDGFGFDNVMIYNGEFTDMAVATDTIVSPSTACSLTATETVSVIVENTGVDTLTSLPICYTINGGTQVCETLSVSIAPLDEQTVSFATTADLSMPGMYNIVVYGSLSSEYFACNDTAMYSVMNGAVNASLTATDVSCNSGSDGSIAVTVSSGSAPLSYAWSNGDTTDTAANLAAGTYVVTVTSAQGCTAVETATISEPTALSLIAAVASNSTCGLSNGSMGAVISGGTTPYTYLWSNGATTQTIASLPAAVYTVTVTDDNGCTIVDQDTVTQPTALSIMVTVDSNVTCNSGSNGGLTVTATGGSLPYVYAWSNGDTTGSITGVVADTYTVTVTDDDGCSFSMSETITEPTAVDASAMVTADVSCFGLTDGAASASASGGTGAHTYMWSNGSSSSTATNLAAGVYTVTATDANGCTDTAQVTVSEPALLIASATVVSNVTCNGFGNGSATATATGGTTAYTYLWSTGGTMAAVSGLSGATYTVTVTDANGCTDSASVTIAEPAALVASSVVDSNASCFGFTDGGATGSASGGTAPYIYAWSNAATTPSITGVAAGTYTVTVTDANGCTDASSVTITEPTLLTASTNMDSLTSCFGSSDGVASATAGGGTAPYSYLWSSGATMATANMLSATVYTVTVTDDNGCTATADVTIGQPALLTVVVTTDSNASCNGDSDGGVSAVAGGGTMPYTYLWNTTATATSIDGLAAGSYTITVTDDNGCTALDTGMVSEPDVLVVQGSVSNTTCSIDSNGSISTTVAGGTGPYTYEWSNAETSENIADLVVAAYTVTVTDDNGCEDDETFTVSFNANDPIVDLGPDTIICGKDSLVLMLDGFASYLWSDTTTGNSLTVNLPGTYSVIVTSDSGCFGSDSIVIDTTFCVGIADRQALASSISLFPNPTSGFVTLSFKATDLRVTGVTVADIAGTAVRTEQRVFVDNETISLEGLPSGSYFLFIETNKGTQIGQVILQ